MKFSEEEFIAICREADPNHYTGSEDSFTVQWRTGGQDGGSCWNEDSHYSLDAEQEPDYSGLKDFLLDLDISLAQYFAILEKEKRRDTGFGGYYGNYTNNITKSIAYSDIYAVLTS